MTGSYIIVFNLGALFCKTVISRDTAVEAMAIFRERLPKNLKSMPIVSIWSVTETP